jgi:hypothetical protein
MGKDFCGVGEDIDDVSLAGKRHVVHREDEH